MPIHLDPPWWRPFCSARRWRSVSINLSKPPIASICACSSLVSSFSARRRSHSSGISPAGPVGAGCRGGRGLETPEAGGEHAVEPVQVALILHQRGAAEEVEVLHAVIRHPRLHGAEQGQVFRDGGRDAVLAQGQHELGEHAPTLLRRRAVRHPQTQRARRIVAQQRGQPDDGDGVAADAPRRPDDADRRG